MRRLVPTTSALLGSMLFGVSLIDGAPPVNPQALAARIQARSAGQGAAAAAKDQQYDLIEIKGPDGSSAGMVALDITNSGTVSVIYFNSADWTQTALLYEDGIFKKTIRHPGSMVTNLIVADSGILFGNWGDYSSQTAGMYDPETDQWTALPEIPGKPVNIGNRMNDAGVGTGAACEGAYGSSFNCVAWVWDTHRPGYRFINPPGADSSQTFGINNRGQIVGTAYAGTQTYAFLEYKGNLTQLRPTEQSCGVDINDPGTILVNSLFAGCTGSGHGGLMDKNGFTLLPDWPNAVLTAYSGMNDRGDLTGNWFDESGMFHGFVAIRKQR